MASASMPRAVEKETVLRQVTNGSHIFAKPIIYCCCWLSMPTDLFMVLLVSGALTISVLKLDFPKKFSLEAERRLEQIDVARISTLQFKQEVMVCRGIVLAAILMACASHAEVQLAVDRLWVTMADSAHFKHDTFEPNLAIFCFIAFSTLFYFIDTQVLSIRKYRIVDSTSMKAWRENGMNSDVILWYLLPLMVIDFMYPRRQIPLQAPSLATLVYEVVACILLYDLFFFFTHVPLHKIPALWRLHKKHHALATIRACEVFAESPFGTWNNVACSVFAIRTMDAHPMSRCIYNIVLIYLLTELHCGYSFPWSIAHLVPYGLWGGSIAHDAHHRKGDKHFGKFGLLRLEEVLMLLVPDPARENAKDAKGRADSSEDGARKPKPSG
jgi:sterol desaturase/sphingolipid hydroxylase (fatty acid hydroxylase superfamily)